MARRHRAVFSRRRSPIPVRALLAPYLDVVAGFNRRRRTDDSIRARPRLCALCCVRRTGSIACELEPNAAAALSRNLARDRRAKAVAIDGWIALNAYVPPPERRGVVVIDPPYEETADFDRLARGLEAAHRKWASGIYLLWYPIKGRDAPDALARRLRRAGIGKILRVELAVGTIRADGPLGGCGLIVVNPPWMLDSESEGHAVRRWRTHWAAKAAPTGSTGSPRNLVFATFPQARLDYL